MNDFKIATTKYYKIDVLVDGVAPAFDVTDVFNLIFKLNINDTDTEAVIDKTGTKTGVDGEVTWLLSATETDVDENTYQYEIKWTSGDAVYIIETDTVSILKRVHDVV